MTETPKGNSWARSEEPQAGAAAQVAPGTVAEPAWRLRALSTIDGDHFFAAARGNAVIRLLAFFARRRMAALVFGLLLLAAAGYFLMAPEGSTLAGIPAALLTVACAGLAVFVALLVTLGAWLRPVESVDDAVAVMTVPLIALEKGVASDVH